MNIFSKFCFCAITVILLAAAPLAARENQQAPITSTHFVLEGLSADSRLGASMIKMIEDCYSSLEQSLPGKMPKKIRLVWKDNSAEFGDSIQDRSHNTLAVAGRRMIICNGPAISQQSIAGSRKTILHELVHVYIAEQSKAGIPRWLNEGLAMHIARETEWQPTFSTSLKNAVGNLPTLKDLSDNFPEDLAGRSEAYLCSFLAVQYLRQHMGLYQLIENLSNPEFAASFYQTEIWKPIDEGYRNEYLTQFGLLNLLFSGEIFWGIIAVLFIAAYLVKRRSTKRKLERMIQEEQLGFDDF